MISLPYHRATWVNIEPIAKFAPIFISTCELANQGRPFVRVDQQRTDDIRQTSYLLREFRWVEAVIVIEDSKLVVGLAGVGKEFLRQKRKFLAVPRVGGVTSTKGNTG